MSDLAAALVEFQSKVPAIPKNRTAKIPTKNGGSYTYRFADLADVWDAIREPLKECGLAVTQGLVGGSSGWTGIKTTIWHSSGERESDILEIPTQGKTAQEAGSQFTYYKRYALTAVLGISTEEDDDGQAGNAPAPARARLPDSDLTPSFKLVEEAAKRLNLSKDDEAQMFQKRFRKEISQASRDELNQLVDKLTEMAVGQEMA